MATSLAQCTFTVKNFISMTKVGTRDRLCTIFLLSQLGSPEETTVAVRNHLKRDNNLPA